MYMVYKKTQLTLKLYYWIYNLTLICLYLKVKLQSNAKINF